MDKLWSTKDLLGQYYRDLLVCRYRLNHCSLKFFLRISKRWIIPRKLSNIIKFPPCDTCIFLKSHKRPWRTKGKHSSGSINKPPETRSGAMTSIE